MTDTEAETDSTRTMYLFDGRRVRLADLLAADLISPGTRLTFDRPRIGETHAAEVTANGMLRLDDGRAFAAPSKAAGVAAGLQAVDGWSAWKLESTGRELGELRSDLLRQDAGTATSESVEPKDGAPLDRVDDDFERIRYRQERLAAALVAADTSPLNSSVRELIGWWDARGRGRQVVERIDADLANYGLTTQPDFSKVTLDAIVRIVHLPSPDDASDSGDGPSSIDQLDEVDEVDLGITLGNITPLGTLVTVSLHADLSEAITHMRINDYSQIPVMRTEWQAEGAVTWKSIALAQLVPGGATKVAQALSPVTVQTFEQELIDAVDVLFADGFVLVSDDTGKIAGIVTTADVVNSYRELAEPFMMLGETDHLLRRILRYLVDIAVVTEHCDPNGVRKIRDFDDLTFGDYQQILGKPDVWQQMPNHLDRRVFGQRLDEIRILRNAVAHFEPEPVTVEDVTKIRHFLELVRELAATLGN